MRQQIIRYSFVALMAVLFGFLGMLPSLYSADAQGGPSNLGALGLRCTECGTATAVLEVDRDALSDNGNIASFKFQGTEVAVMQPSGNLSIDGQVDFWRYQDVPAAPDVFAEAAVISTTTTLTSGQFLGVAVSRNVVLTWVTVTTATAGNVTVTGVNARGVADTDVIAVGAVSGTQTLTGDTPFQAVTSMTLPARTEALTLTVKGGQLFGLPRLPNAAGDLYHLTVNLTPAVPTVNPTLGTFNPVVTPAAGVDYDVWMRK
jgi:hypothetical protein